MPIWNDDTLIADETIDYGHGDAEARRFIMALADALGVDAQHVIPAYEDVWHYLWRERRLPVNVDPLKSELKNEEERARLARSSSRGSTAVVGYVLPFERRDDRTRAATGRAAPGSCAPEHLFLIPGDSPIGFRLPLDSLPWVGAGGRRRDRSRSIRSRLRQPPLSRAADRARSSRSRATLASPQRRSSASAAAAAAANRPPA